MSLIQSQITRMRAQADFLARYQDFFEAFSCEAATEADPGAKWNEVSYISVQTYWYLEITCHGSKSRELMAAARSRFGGLWKKAGYGDTFTLRRDFDDFTVEIDGQRDKVCERKVVGMETKVIPAVEAQPEHVEEVEIVEWDCGPVLPTESEAK